VRVYVSAVMRQSFVIRHWLWGLFLEHAPECTSLQNLDLLLVCLIEFLNHICLNMEAGVAVVLNFVPITQTQPLLCELGQRFLGDVSSLAPVFSSFSSAHVLCVFSHCLTWNLLLKTFLCRPICKLFSYMEMENQETCLNLRCHYF
jgi:hypothetical protein